MAGNSIEIGRMAGRKTLQPGQISRLVTVGRSGSGRHVVLETERLVEAPNWTRDGAWLIVNSEGAMYRIRPDGTGGLEPIAIGAVTDCNNDHVVSPDGRLLYFSAAGHLYCVPIEGGEPRRISNDHAPRDYTCWLHGISPDGTQLAYVAVEPKDGVRRRHVALIPAAGGPDTALTPADIPADGPEYSPDGRWLYFNSEMNAAAPGHAQIFRMRPDGSEPEQLTFDERVNWFPHLSPDGTCFVYLSYAPGTRSHPADVDVLIRCLPADGGSPQEVVALFGGQGSLNVNSWAPDSRRFAYVEYPPTR